MSVNLELTGNGEEDKQVVFDAIREEAESRGLEFVFRPIDDRDHYSFGVNSRFDSVNGVILSSDSRRGNDIWVGMSGTTYAFFVHDENTRWRKTVVIVDSVLKHVIYAPFEILKPEMEREEKRSLLKYTDNWNHIFTPLN